MITVVIGPGRATGVKDETKAGPTGTNEREAEIVRMCTDSGRAHTIVLRITEGGVRTEPRRDFDHENGEGHLEGRIIDQLVT